MDEFLPVAIYLGIVFFVTLGALAASGMISPRSKGGAKYLPYESGIRTEAHLAQERFPLRHYLVGLIFLIFDVEVIFFYPWAVIAKEVGLFVFYEMVFFLIILMIGFGYVWKKGGLEQE